MMKAGGDSACTRADLQLVRALGRGLCSAVALATWWTPHAGELATLRRLRRVGCSGSIPGSEGRD